MGFFFVEDRYSGLLDTFSVPACCASRHMLCYNDGKFFPVVWRGRDGVFTFFPLLSTLSIDAGEQNHTLLVVSLSAISSVVPCPRCGTPGSRIHSRYRRTVADVACGGQRVVLKLTVRKWVCSSPSCSQRIFAEHFVELVQRYARMTDRLIQTLQSVGTTTNGADGARLSSKLAMPTTGKTIIRRVRCRFPCQKTPPFGRPESTNG